LLTAVTQHRAPIFSDFQLGRLVVEQLRLAHEERIVTSIAWVVMPDHFHWMLELHDKTLGELMCRIKSRSSLSINKAKGSIGRLWQKGYHDRALRKEENVKNVARYIIQNPLRANLAQRAGDYPLWDAQWL
jgi:REP element-mobilizing transposase RayT